MKNFNRNEALAKANIRIIQLEDKLSESLSKIDGLIFASRELKLKVEKLSKENEELLIVNKSLTDKVAQLEKRLKIDSSNSSLPPSSNRFIKATVSNRGSSNKPSGGQEDHVGGTLDFSKEPTDKETHKPKECSSCGNQLLNFKLLDTRQVHDVVISRKITNHYIYSGSCNCGCETISTTIVPHGVSYGNGIKSILLYLHNKDFLPTKRLETTAMDLFGIPVSEGSIYNWQTELSTNLNHYEDSMIEELYKQATLHADESGMKVKKLTMWLHVISNKYFTYYDVQAKRGIEAMNATNVLPNYSGNLVHDCFKSYHKLAKIKHHGLCNAHLLRELKSMNQFYDLSFANRMRDLLLSMHVAKKSEKLTYQIKLQYKAEFRKLIALAQTEALTLTNEKWKKDVLALANRLIEHGEKYLAFLDIVAIPFTNNQAEQDIRMIKVKQKISGGFRTEKGAKHFLKIRGFISTMIKKGHNILTSIQKVIVDPTDYNLSNST